MAIAPDLPSGALLGPFEHLAWYEFFEAQPPVLVRVKNQFSGENKGAIWEVFDGRFLLVPATMDFQGAIELGQHCGIGIVRHEYSKFPVGGPSNVGGTGGGVAT